MAQTQYDYRKQWATVDSLLQKGQPRSADTVLQAIYLRAEQDQQAVHLVKAAIFRTSIALEVEERSLNEIIRDVRNGIEKAPPLAKPLLHSVLGQTYWQYYQQNRWRFMNRTAVQMQDDDLETWDLKKILSEAATQFRASVADPAQLQRIPVGFYNEVIYRKGDLRVRPTAFDFFAHQALDFFTNTEAGLYSVETDFAIQTAQWYAPARQFVQDSILKQSDLGWDALQLWQDLTRFHLKDAHPAALISLELNRLAFVYAQDKRATKAADYEAALRALTSTYQDAAVAEAWLGLASLYQQTGNAFDPKAGDAHRLDWHQTIQICDQVHAQYAGTHADLACQSLRNEIRTRSVGIMLPQGIESKRAFPVRVEFRNVPYVYLKAIPVTQTDRIKLTENYQAQVAFIKKARKQKGVAFLSVKMPDQGDYRSHSTEVAFPALAAGHYYILASGKEDFSDAQEMQGATMVDVNDLSLIQRTPAGESTEYYVLNRTTGAPISGAKVEVYVWSYEGRSMQLQGTYTSDANGFVRVQEKTDGYGRNGQIRVRYQKQLLISSSYSYGRWWGESEKPTIRTFFFTDRSIYRPGQSVYFKALVLRQNGRNNWEIVADHQADYTFYNVNGDKVSSQRLTTNAFGTVTGNFTAPSGVLTGQMRIDGENGNAYFRVEEYKRPRFEVAFKPQAGSPALNEEVTTTVTANSYAGAKISNAKVSYRVTRGAELPAWSWWFRWWNPKPPMEVAQGEGVTDENGVMDIRFTAKADPTLDPKTEPIFVYTIEATVTDITGETHTESTMIRVGYKSLLLRAEVPEVVAIEDLKSVPLITTNLNSQPVSTKGQLTLSRLNNPAVSLRERAWSAPELQVLSEAEFRRLLPKDPYGDELEPRNWAVGETVLSLPFNTADSKSVALNPQGWKAGVYLLTLTAKDAQNREVITKQLVTVYSKAAATVVTPRPYWYQVIKASGQPGEEAVLQVGSTENIRLLVEVEHKGKVVSSKWMTLNNEQKTLRFPIEEKHRGNFSVQLAFVRDNRAYLQSQLISVPFSNKELKLAFETFRNKLMPGQQEEWRLKISGPEGEAVAAELVAALYDASLDQFQPHGWGLNLWQYEGSALGWNDLGFGETSASLSVAEDSPNVPEIGYDELGIGLGDLYDAPNALQANAEGGKVKSVLKTNTISGTVQVEKKPKKGALVHLEGTDLFTYTDAQGKFAFTNVPAGQYDVAIWQIGSSVVIVSVTVAANSGADLEVHLAAYQSSRRYIYSMAPGMMARSEAVYDMAAPPPPPPAPVLSAKVAEEVGAAPKEAPAGNAEQEKPAAAAKTDLSGIKARTNLNETAFFMPQLRTNAEGDVILSFTMPEALTRWRMMGLAHTKDLKVGEINESVVTQKDLMVTPNAPRFFREQDEITFTAKVDNLSDRDLSGVAQLFLLNALTNEPIDGLFANNTPQVSFSAVKNGNALLSWKLKVPEGISAVTYRVVAKADQFSDGEEAALPVLTNRMLVTESLPLPVRGDKTTKFTFDKLLNQKSTTLRHEGLTVEFTPNPIWYAVQAIPYMMEYPYECAEQTFTRFYANAIAKHIVDKQPRIREIFRAWETTDQDAFLSNLSKNQELKAVMLEETPWVFEAADEKERKKRIGILFDTVRMSHELGATLQKLKESQMGSGAWGWFNGMQEDRWVTQHIVTGFARLASLKVLNPLEGDTKDMITRAIAFLDREIVRDYQYIQDHREADHLGYVQIQYLYARGGFSEIPIPESSKTAFDYYVGQAKKYWLGKSNYMQGMIALGLKGLGDEVTPAHITRSLRERAVYGKELGMYWKSDSGYFWYQAPIETQSLLIELFHRMNPTDPAVEDMKLWLLKQKQTQDWKTTTATASAVYALLLQGTDLLNMQQTVKITLGNTVIDPQNDPALKSEAGTGYFKTRISGADVKPEMGRITVQKTGSGAAWGAVYWQYFEQLDKITPAATPLKLTRTLTVERNTPQGPVLTPITEGSPVKTGDRIKVRLVLKVDRAMEYIHLKDMRAAGFEPENVISQYRYQDGLGYYEATRDAATNFFISWLNPGTYVFEYALRATQAGNFSTGISSIQCMYAPEFTSHTEGVRVSVVK